MDYLIISICIRIKSYKDAAETQEVYRSLPQEPQKLFSGGLSAPHALHTTCRFLLLFSFFFHGLGVSPSMALVFFAIQIRNTSEKMINPMAIIIEITTGLENIVLLLYSFFIVEGSENH